MVQVFIMNLPAVLRRCSLRLRRSFSVGAWRKRQAAEYLKGILFFQYAPSTREEPSLRASQPLKLYANAVGEANKTRRSPESSRGSIRL
jgi:hypothetical protein